VRPILGLVMAALVASVGCATTQGPSWSGYVTVDELGRTQLTGHGDPMVLTGAHGRELASIPGAHVKVWGPQLGQQLAVRRYQIIDVGNGFHAYVGQLLVDQGGARLVEGWTGRLFWLTGVDPRELVSLHARRIWITGFEEGADRLRPLTWGPLGPTPEQ